MTRAEDTARRIDLYTDSPAEKREFSEWAQHAGKPLSPFLMAKLRQLRASEGQKRAAGLLRAVEGMKKRIADLESELAEAQAHRDQYKAALDREKVLAFPEGDEAEYGAALIQALKDHGPIHENSLLAVLRVDPKDLQLRRAIGLQLGALEGYGLIKKGVRGWRWVG